MSTFDTIVEAAQLHCDEGDRPSLSGALANIGNMEPSEDRPPLALHTWPNGEVAVSVGGSLLTPNQATWVAYQIMELADKAAEVSDR